MYEGYDIDIRGVTYNIQLELDKIEISMEEEFIQFFYEAREDRVKKEALIGYIESLIIVDKNTPFSNFNYYTLIARYEELYEANCEQ